MIEEPTAFEPSPSGARWLGCSSERVRCWDVDARVIDCGGMALLSMRDSRTGKAHLATGFRFPAGWRSTELDKLNVPHYVKAAARRNMNKLLTRVGPS